MAKPPAETLRRFYDEIESWPRRAREEHTGLKDRLRGVGMSFYEDFLPPRLADRLTELCSLSDVPLSMCVMSDETLFPWELACLPGEDGRPGPFLAEAFALTRWVFDHEQALELPLSRIALVKPKKGVREKGETGELGGGNAEPGA